MEIIINFSNMVEYKIIYLFKLRFLFYINSNKGIINCKYIFIYNSCNKNNYNRNIY